MEGLWWLIGIVLLLLFGKKFGLNIGNGFSLDNQLPTNQSPASTTQDNTNPPSAQPPPWHSPCRTIAPPSNEIAPRDPLITVSSPLAPATTLHNNVARPVPVRFGTM